MAELSIFDRPQGLQSLAYLLPGPSQKVFADLGFGACLGVLSIMSTYGPLATALPNDPKLAARVEKV